MLLCFHAAALQPHLRGTRVAAAVAHTAFSMVGCLRAIPPGLASRWLAFGQFTITRPPCRKLDATATSGLGDGVLET